MTSSNLHETCNVAQEVRDKVQTTSLCYIEKVQTGPHTVILYLDTLFGCFLKNSNQTKRETRIILNQHPDGGVCSQYIGVH